MMIDVKGGGGLNPPAETGDYKMLNVVGAITWRINLGQLIP